MALSDFVNVSISVQSAGPSRAGFGTPLILANRPAASSSIKTTEIRSYTGTGEVAEDYNSDEFTYLAAAKIFSQSPSISKIKAAVLPTPSTGQTFVIGLDNVASGSAITGSLVSPAGSGSVILADPGAATSDLADNLATALGAISGLSASSDGNVVTATGDTNGAMWEFTEDLVGISIYDSTADWGYDDHLDEVLSRDTDFYFVITDNNSAKNIDKVARWAAANEKLFVCSPQFTRPAEWGSDLFTAGADYTSLLANQATILLMTKDGRSSAKDAAWVSVMGAKDAGSATWAFKTLLSTGADDWTSTEKALISGDTINGNYYITQNSVNFTFPGQCCDGSYADIKRGKDWLKTRMQERLFGLMLGNDKLPYTNAGMEVIKAEVLAQLKEAFNREFITSDYAVTIPAVSEQSVSDRGNRIVRRVNFTATLQGAVHKIFVNGTISL